MFSLILFIRLLDEAGLSRAQVTTSTVQTEMHITEERYGKTRSEITEPYGVDEFMYFLEGSVTLTSSDGTVQTIEAGEAVTIPKEWTGIWDTNGYTKIWVIYSEDGSALE